MKWNLPPKIKIYEALGAIGDNRINIYDDTAQVVSSSGNKTYQIKYDSQTNSIMANDNASYFVGYLGYPSIAYLLKKEILKYDLKWADALTGIAWKDINQKNKNNFDKTKQYVDEQVEEKGFDRKELEDEVEHIYQQIGELDLNLLGKKVRPPRGY